MGTYLGGEDGGSPSRAVVSGWRSLYSRSRMTAEERSPETAQAVSRRLRELGLKIEGSPMEPLIQNLYKELEAKGIELRPQCFVADEWGCPDGVPAIGIPFYLIDPELAAVEELETAELESEAEVRRLLRHEAGHVFCYAHKLYVLPDFRELFGPFSRPYLDDFQPQPFSRSYVRHLPGWYAQKHPDEDFAESFAVFITPELDWHKQYANWPALKKLIFIEEKVKELGKAPPQVTVKPEDLTFEAGLDVTVPEHYQRLKAEPAVMNLGEQIDPDLVELFGPPAADGEPAAKFIRQQRKTLLRGVIYWTGARSDVVRGLIDHLSKRVEVLGLVVPAARVNEVSASLASLVTTLVINHMVRGKFFEL